jgi:hypothetical protein
VRRLYLQSRITSQSVRVEILERSLERVCSQTDQSEYEAAVSRPWWRRGRRRSRHYCKSLRSNAKLVVRQSQASMNVNTKAEEATALEAVTRQPVKTQQTEKA